MQLILSILIKYKEEKKNQKKFVVDCGRRCCCGVWSSWRLKAERGNDLAIPEELANKILLEEGSSMKIVDTGSHTNNSLVLTPVILRITCSSTKAVTSVSKETVRPMALNRCTFFCLCLSHTKPVTRLIPISTMLSKGSNPLGSNISSRRSRDFCLHIASPLNISASFLCCSIIWRCWHAMFFICCLIYLICLFILKIKFRFNEVGVFNRTS